MKLTARQLKVADSVATCEVVVSVQPSTDRRTVTVELLSTLTVGKRRTVVFPANTVLLDVVRDYDDEINNPYFWALEAEAEAQEDARIAEYELAMADFY